MKKLHIVAVTLGVGLVVWGVWFAKVAIEHEHDLRMWAATPNIGFNVTLNRPSSDACFTLGLIDPDEAPAPLMWDQFFLRKSDTEGYRDFPFPGASGQLRIGSKTCGFDADGYYDPMYRPTMYPAWFIYPECGENPQGREKLDPRSCVPPTSWD